MKRSSASAPRAGRKTALALTGIVLAAIGAAWSGWRMSAGQDGTGHGSTVVAARNAVAEQPSIKTSVPNTMPDSGSENVIAAPAAGQVAAAAARLRNWTARFHALMEDKSLDDKTRKAKARVLLAQLREELRNAPADAAAAAIVQFLDSGADSPTGLGFTLASGGVLADAPSMRTALLDLLAQFDPSAAVSYAQKVFNGSQVADEWALAMRNLGWQNQDGAHTAELRARLTQMLDNQSWLAHPTGGVFEAFDTAVHLGGIAELENMASVMHLRDADGNAVKNGTTHAAYLALDRIMTRKPEQTLSALANDPELLSWSPEHRGALMARADVSQPSERAAIETYLDTLGQRPQELETFATMFPNRNGLLGNALITTPVNVPNLDQMLLQDQSALATVQEWLQSGRYGAIETSLRQISDRLTGFIRDAQADGAAGGANKSGI